MTGECCRKGRPSGRLARRLSSTMAFLLPAAVLALVPKYPLCLAAWLTLATGAAVSAGAASRVRGLAVVICISATVLLAQTVWRSGLRRF